jgi:hypothetical protein
VTTEVTDVPTLDPTTPGADEIYAFALQLAVTGHSLTDAAEAIRQLAGGDETPIESALTLAECGCRDTPLDLAARQAMYVLGRALLTEEL